MATCQGTIIPHQLRKHGFGSYPLDISGETAHALQVFPTKLLFQADFLWFIVGIVVLFNRGQDRKEIEANTQYQYIL